MDDWKNNEKRTIKRSLTSMAIVVKGRESPDSYWKEIAEIINVSRLGANFHIQRECPTGRILSLIMKLPKNFRRYDLDKKLYRVWALVQYCTPMSHKGAEGYQIGVAFVGKQPPESYVKDPQKAYRVHGMDEDGFWSIGESKTSYISRAHHRFLYSEEAEIALIDSEGEVTEIDNNAVTKNISIGGTAVSSRLEVNTGDCVRFTCQKFDFSSICVVRNRQIIEGGQKILHLSFSEPKFPVGKLLENIKEFE